MKHLLYILILIIFSSCVKDKPQPSEKSDVQLSSGKKVFIVNEGPFNSSHGSVSLYDPATNQIVDDVFYDKNNLYLGNIVQSMNYFNNRYYFVNNNSANIVVCDNNFKKIAQINGVMSPRYILPITNQKAYVSDLYANAISIVDLSNNIKIGSVSCHGKTEKMALIYNKAFVTNTDKEYVYIVNTLNDSITDSVFVGFNAGSIEIDKHDKIWVLGRGKSSAFAGKLSKINPITNTIESSFNFQMSDSPNNLCINKTKDTLYFLNEHIFRMPINENNLPTSLFINSGTKNFYGLGVNPNDYTIYSADALDYIQKSNIYVYNLNGTEKNNFKAGLISNGFYFE
jgi:hypothetical protein